jgi:hypothetical protein
MEREGKVHPPVEHMPNVQQNNEFLAFTNIFLLQPIAKQYAQRSGCDCDDLIQVSDWD